MAFARESGKIIFKGQTQDGQISFFFTRPCSASFTSGSSTELECPVDLIIRMTPLQTALISESLAALEQRFHFWTQSPRVLIQCEMVDGEVWKWLPKKNKKVHGKKGTCTPVSTVVSTHTHTHTHTHTCMHARTHLLIMCRLALGITWWNIPGGFHGNSRALATRWMAFGFHQSPLSE